MNEWMVLKIYRTPRLASPLNKAAKCVLSGLGTHRSKERPQAMTDTFSGSPMGSSISGRKSPEFPTSTHFFKPVRAGEG